MKDSNQLPVTQPSTGDESEFVFQHSGQSFKANQRTDLLESPAPDFGYREIAWVPDFRELINAILLAISLDERALQVVLSRRVFGKTLADVGREQGLSRERVRQIEADSYRALEVELFREDLLELVSLHFQEKFDQVKIVTRKLFEEAYSGEFAEIAGQKITPLEFFLMFNMCGAGSIFGLAVVVVTGITHNLTHDVNSRLQEIYPLGASVLGETIFSDYELSIKPLQEIPGYRELCEELSQLWGVKLKSHTANNVATVIKSRLLDDLCRIEKRLYQLRTAVKSTPLTNAELKEIHLLQEQLKPLNDKVPIFVKIITNSKILCRSTSSEAAKYLDVTESDLMVAAPRFIECVLRENSQDRSETENQWSKANCIRALQDASLYAFPLTTNEYSELLATQAIKGPSVPRLFQIFGSWLAACDAAGVESGTPIREYVSSWTNSQLMTILKTFLMDVSEESDSPAAFASWARKKGEDYPGSQTITNRLGGPWSKVRAEAYKQIINEELL